MPGVKIAVIGAGSASFGLNTLASLLREERLRGSHLALIDRDAEALKLMHQLAERLNHAWDAGFSLSCHTSVAEDDSPESLRNDHPLDGAQFVILSIEVPPREQLWQSDFEIPLKYGVRQPYAENGGPGGFAHACRNIPPILEIARAMEKHCPRALLLNFTNPMVRICDVLHRYSSLEVVGLCHQIEAGYAMVGKALADDLGLAIPEGFNSCHAHPMLNPLRQRIANEVMSRVEIRAAGLNHFTWMMSLHTKADGDDLYPLFASRWSALDPTFEPLTRRIYADFGLFPIPGDEHLCEYLPWMSDPLTHPWDRFDLSLYDWRLAEAERARKWSQVEAYIRGQAPVDELREVHSEGAAEILTAMVTGAELDRPAVNLPNRGAIPNLPEEAIVETPGVVNGEGVHAMPMPPLPDGIAELCRRELAAVRLCVDAAVKGDRRAALHCLLLDPVIRDLDAAQSILDDYLSTYRDLLPQFKDA